MDLPAPPEDAELKNIIDKLAQFVARNGIQFEQMTKNKQRDNPKFRFLYGGEYFNYYQYKVTTEQQILKQREKVAQQQAIIQDSITQHSIQSAPWQQQEVPPTQTLNIDDKINSSKQNLLQQLQQLRQQQQEKIEEILNNYKDNWIRSMAEELQINLMIFEQRLQPIIENCTKESIAAGKQWIFDNSKSRKHTEIISKFMLQKILMRQVSFDVKLHLIYLINDLLHHCFRKSAEDLLQSLKLIVVPAFCNTMIGIDEEKKLKLERLFILWEKNHYFDANTIEKLKNPILSMSNYQVNLMTEHNDLIQQVQASTQAQIQHLQKQHDDFVNHLTTLKQSSMAGPPPALPVPVAPSLLPPPSVMVHDYQHGQQSVPIIPDFSKPPPGFPPHLLPIGTPNFTSQQSAAPPEPTYTNSELLSETTIPKLLYFDLPAGLMIPLLKMENFNYESLDPTAIRLPPPQPPTERLLAAVEAFYSPPSRDRPRNSEGWEQNGLYEYYREKQHIKQVMKEKVSEIKNTPTTDKPNEEIDSSIKDRARSKSRSRSNSPKRRFRSRSRSNSPQSNSPKRRSPPPRSKTPPSDYSLPLPDKDLDPKLDENNKGHKLLTKMGWSGQGLGSSEQGRLNPISGGEARDRGDKYKGVGIPINDPFEKFRKTKSYSFITKIRARDDPPT